jgi:hypothetical protein
VFLLCSQLLNVEKSFGGKKFKVKCSSTFLGFHTFLFPNATRNL